MKNKGDKDLVSVQPEMLSFVDKTDLDSLEYDQLVELGRGVAEVKTYSNWILGKLGDAALKRFGDLSKYAKDINQNYPALQQYMNAYRKYTREDPDFSPDKYFGRVPWGLLQMVATKSDTPIKLLNELVDKGATSIESGYREIKEKETGQQVPRKPLIKFYWAQEVGKWRIDLKKEDLDLIDWTDVKQQLLDYLESLT